MLFAVMGRGELAVGLVYETFETYERRASEPEDSRLEYEPEETIAVLEAAVARLGHRSLRLGSPHEVLSRLTAAGALGVDVALNIAEGFGSRNREGWAPTLLEMAGIPTLGSDALTLSLSLDKLWTNRAVAQSGVRVAPQVAVAAPESARRLDLASHGLAFPLFVKPRWEGSAKGIRATSRVEDRDGLVQEVDRVVRQYRQPALVECFLPGAEYTVALVGNDPPQALPVLQRALEAESRIGLHALEAHAEAGVQYLPGVLTAPLEEQLQAMAIRVWHALDCLDFARCDFRLDAAGEPTFLEINPLPTFAPDGTFAILAELAGRSLPDLLSEVLTGGLRRLGLPERANPAEAAAR